MAFAWNLFRMVIRLITCSLMVLNVVEAAFCFDDSIGHILVTLQDRSIVAFRKWSLKWDGDCNWSPVSATAKGGAGTVTGSGCCSGGVFRMMLGNNKAVIGGFVTTAEVHLLCAPGAPYCSFSAVVHSTTTFPLRALISGKMQCNCVLEKIEIGEAARENSTNSSTYIAPVENLIEFEDRNIFNN